MALLGEILLSEKVLTPKQLNTALEMHVLHGVKLGTCLVEMGYITDEVLAQCLWRKKGTTVLTKDQLLAFGFQNLSVISPAAIKKYRIVPVGIQNGALRIATDLDLSPKQQAELEVFIGRKIEPVAVSGYAVDCFLEQVFGIQRPGRFLHKFSGIKIPETKPITRERRSEKPAHLVIDGVEWKSLGDLEHDDAADKQYDDFFNLSDSGSRHLRTLAEVANQLSQAKSRDDVAKTVLNYLSAAFSTVALVIIKDGLVLGWIARSHTKNLANFEAYASPLNDLPELQRCVVTKRPYFCNSLSESAKQLLRMPHHAGGQSACVPIIIQQRVVAVIVCDGTDNYDFSEFDSLCRKIAYSLEILILRSKLLS